MAKRSLHQTVVRLAQREEQFQLDRLVARLPECDGDGLTGRALQDIGWEVGKRISADNKVHRDTLFRYERPSAMGVVCRALLPVYHDQSSVVVTE